MSRTVAERRAHRLRTRLARRRLQGGAIVAAALLLTVLAYVKPDPFADTQRVRIVVDDATGTQLVGGEVRMAGTPVGKVVERKRSGDDAILTLEIESSAGTITRRARAEVRPRTAFEGPVFVTLDPGAPSAPPLGNAVLPRSQTRNYVPLDQALRFAVPDIRRAIGSDVAELRAALGGSGAESMQHVLRSAPDLTRTLAPAARAARGVHGAELSRAVARITRTVEVFSGRRDTLAPTARSTAKAFDALATDGGAPLGRLVDELPGRLSGLDRGGRDLAALVDDVRDFGGDVRPALRSVAPTVSVLEPVLRRADPVLRDTAPLLRDLRGALDSGGRAAPSARGLLTALTPSLQLLDGSLLPAMAKPTSLGLPSYLQFVSLFQGGGGASRPFQTAAQASPPSTGEGHFMRFNARFFTGVGYPLPPCSAIAGAAPQIAESLAANGGCAP